MTETTREAVLEYWLGDAETSAEESKRRSKRWYGFNPEIDQQITHRFKATLLEAETGKLDSWSNSPTGSLALVILLDQMSRNIYRGTAAAFKNDETALNIAKKVIANLEDRELSYIGRAFLYHPFEHSENLQDQETSVALFDQLSQEGNEAWSTQLGGFLKFAIEHRDIIRKFGRFPHRNALLGRTNTPQEDEYLAKDKRTFGQGKG